MALRICLIVPSFGVGGALKTAFKVFSQLSDDYDIHIIPLNFSGNLFNSVPKNFAIHDIGSGKAYFQMFKAVWLLKSTRPQIVYLTHGYTVALYYVVSILMGYISNVCYRETSVLNKLYDERGIKLWFQRILSSWAYKKLDLIICQSNFMAREIDNFFGVNRNVMVVINNPAVGSYENHDIPKYCESGNKDKSFSLIYCGRLEPEKGVDRIINAMRYTCENVFLKIIGNGSKMDELKKLCKSLDLCDRVSFHGYQSNPSYYIANSDALILTSLHESFSNSVLEANALGVPVLATECPGGLSELIREDINGRLVEYKDSRTLAKSIEYFFEYEWDSQAIREFVFENFGLEKVKMAYMQAFEKLR